jgi:hypothetical protein
VRDVVAGLGGDLGTLGQAIAVVERT